MEWVRPRGTVAARLALLARENVLTLSYPLPEPDSWETVASIELGRWLDEAVRMHAVTTWDLQFDGQALLDVSSGAWGGATFEAAAVSQGTELWTNAALWFGHGRDGRVQQPQWQTVVHRRPPARPDVAIAALAPPRFRGRRALSKKAPIFGVVGAWNEGDVIEAAVSNAFEIGCQRVFVLDNDSTDDTAARARLAGGTVARWSSSGYDEGQRIARMTETMVGESERTGASSAWWLWFDADEFPELPPGETLRTYIGRFHPKVRIGGSTLANHLPLGADSIAPYTDPRSGPSLWYRWAESHCLAGHNNHPLMKWERGGPPLNVSGGFHRVWCTSDVLYESAHTLLVRHFPIRSREVTEARLRALAGLDGVSGDRLARHEYDQHFYDRLAALEHVYRGDWNRVTFEGGRPGYVPDLHPWNGRKTGRAPGDGR